MDVFSSFHMRSICSAGVSKSWLYSFLLVEDATLVHVELHTEERLQDSWVIDGLKLPAVRLFSANRCCGKC